MVIYHFYKQSAHIELKRNALDDLGCSNDLLKTNRYSKALFHFQQSTEKAIKACLAISGKLVVKEHKCTHLFKKYVIPVLSKQLQNAKN